MNSNLGTGGQGEQRGFLRVTKWVMYPPPTPSSHPRHDLLTLISLVLWVTRESFPRPTWSRALIEAFQARGRDHYLSLFSGWGTDRSTVSTVLPFPPPQSPRVQVKPGLGACRPEQAP